MKKPLMRLFRKLLNLKQKPSHRVSVTGAFAVGVDKTWPRPWPTLWPTLWPTGGRFFGTSLSIALNLCKQRAPSICHTYDSLRSSL